MLVIFWHKVIFICRSSPVQDSRPLILFALSENGCNPIEIHQNLFRMQHHRQCIKPPPKREMFFEKRCNRIVSKLEPRLRKFSGAVRANKVYAPVSEQIVYRGITGIYSEGNPSIHNCAPSTMAVLLSILEYLRISSYLQISISLIKLTNKLIVQLKSTCTQYFRKRRANSNVTRYITHFILVHELFLFINNN